LIDFDEDEKRKSNSVGVVLDIQIVSYLNIMSQKRKTLSNDHFDVKRCQDIIALKVNLQNDPQVLRNVDLTKQQIPIIVCANGPKFSEGENDIGVLKVLWRAILCWGSKRDHGYYAYLTTERR
jgi:hypothetical protein